MCIINKLCAGFGPIEPAQGMLALSSALSSVDCPISIIGPLSWSKLWKVPGRRKSSFYQEFSDQDSIQKDTIPSSLEQADTRPSYSPAENVLSQSQVKSVNDIPEILKMILTGILGTEIASDQPLMEVSKFTWLHYAEVSYPSKY